MESFNFSSNLTALSRDENFPEDWLYIILLTVFLVSSFVVSSIAVVGNAIIMHTMICEKKLRESSIFSFIISIAVNDLIQGLLPAAMALEAFRIMFSWVSQNVFRFESVLSQ